MYIVSKLYNCGIFQGASKKKNYFEGWYFKHVNAAKNNMISVIPGISYEDDRDKSHAFIQIIDGRTCKTHYVRYGIEEFSFSKKNFEFQIGDCLFSDRGIDLNIQSEDIDVQGKLVYSNLVHWPSNIASPNSMGWYAYMPAMECYHGVLSMHHNLIGELKVNGGSISFDEGLGYIEKDWGSSFPSSWIWFQSNHFDIENLSLMVSIAMIPWHGRSFRGFIAGLWNGDNFYRFATYTGAHVDALAYKVESIRICISDKNYMLFIEAQQGNAGSLQAPVKGAMTGNVMESISGNADIRLHDKKTGRLILQTKASCCGMEVGGNIQELVSLP